MTDKAKIQLIFSTIFTISFVAGFYAYMAMNDGVNVFLPQVAQGVASNVPAFKVPANFKVTLFANDLPNARVMQFDPSGNILVSEPTKGRVMLLQDKDNNGQAEQRKVLLDKLNKPHGLAMWCDPKFRCKLFVAEENRISSYDYDRINLKVINKKKVADLPRGGNHSTKSLIAAQVGTASPRLYVSIGSTCNVCNEKDKKRASVLSMKFDGTDVKTFATGLRNTVFMRQNPLTSQIWSTDMGRDLLGDKLPPDEVNVLQQGKNYGWPICYGKNIYDTNFDKKRYIRNPCADKSQSIIDLPAHTAPLGLDFFSSGWPSTYANKMLVAMHGSWNSSVKVGYKVVMVTLDKNNKPTKIEDFMTGFLNGKVAGRPVDVQIRPNGMIYISDDAAGAIYRLQYTGATSSKGQAISNNIPYVRPCIKTGCSQQICSDRVVESTCEYKKEYSCYKNAACERQADGKCGFTQTDTLKACISS